MEQLDDVRWSTTTLTVVHVDSLDANLLGQRTPAQPRRQTQIDQLRSDSGMCRIQLPAHALRRRSRAPRRKFLNEAISSLTSARSVLTSEALPFSQNDNVRRVKG